MPQEDPQYGNGDYRPCAYQIQADTQETFSDLRYVGYEIRQGKPKLKGLPTSFGHEEVVTLILHTKDEILGVCVDLYYSGYNDHDIMARSVAFYFKVLSQPAAPFVLLKVKDLALNQLYEDLESKEVYESNELMY